MPWTPLETLRQRIHEAGGFVNAHAHFDRAYTVQPADVGIGGNSNRHLFDKWEIVNKYKSGATEETYFEHIELALDAMQRQRVQACLSFIDCDPVCEDRAVRVASAIREDMKFEAEADGDPSRMKFIIACQTLQGVRDPEARKWTEKALDYVDIIGGLPKRDYPYDGEHLDTLMGWAKDTGKRLHVHVDQLNSPDEYETEKLARYTMRHGLEGQVTAVHSISLAAHPERYRREVYKMCRDAGLSFVTCPTAWIDARRSPVWTPTHNAITPLDEMLEEGLVVAIGTDNIADVYKPYCDGDLMTELRVLLEATHTYDLDSLVRVATANGLKVLGLD